MSRTGAALAALPLVLAIALKTMGEPVRPEDLWWHLGIGRLIVSTHAVPTVDVFSFTRRGTPYFDQPWLSQILLFWGHRLGGLAALLDFDFLAMLLAEALVIGSSLRRGARLAPALLVQFALSPLAARGWSLRPQTFAVPVFAYFLYILTGWRDGARAPLTARAHIAKREVASLVVLMVFWANVHGTFPLGIGLVLLAMVATAIDLRGGEPGMPGQVSTTPRLEPGTCRRPFALAAAGCALAPLVNPRGPALATYVTSVVRSPSLRIASEWKAVTLANAEGAYILAVLVLTALIALWKRPRAGDLVLLLPFVLLDVRAVRNGIWLSFVLGPLLSSWTAPSPARSTSGRSSPSHPTGGRPHSAVVVGVAAAVLLLALPWLKPRLVPPPFGSLVLDRRTPIAAVEMLAHDDRRPARLLHGMAVGSYLIWALPSQAVFVDPRLEHYPAEQWQDVETLERGEGIDTMLARYASDGFFCTKERESRLVVALRRRPDFELRYEDASFAYFVRR